MRLRVRVCVRLRVCVGVRQPGAEGVSPQVAAASAAPRCRGRRCQQGRWHRSRCLLCLLCLLYLLYRRVDV